MDTRNVSKRILRREVDTGNVSREILRKEVDTGNVSKRILRNQKVKENAANDCQMLASMNSEKHWKNQGPRLISTKYNTGSAKWTLNNKPNT